MENGVRVAKVLLGHYIMNSIIFAMAVAIDRYN